MAQLLHYLRLISRNQAKSYCLKHIGSLDTRVALTFQEGEASQQAYALLARSVPWQLPSLHVGAQRPMRLASLKKRHMPN